MTSPAQVTVYGAAYSVYVKAVRLTLWAKRVQYALVEVDVFSEGGIGPDYLSRHPFGRIPALEHEGFSLYETGPIYRYVDEAFAGPGLQPPSPSSRARMGQVISIMDSYAYRSLVWGLYTEQVQAPREGRRPDSGRIEAARQRSAVCLRALEALAPAAHWLAGEALTLADLHAAPMFALFMRTPDAETLIAPNARLAAWWSRVAEHVAPAHVL